MRRRSTYVGLFAVLFLVTAIPSSNASSAYYARMMLSHRNPPANLITLLDAAESPGNGAPVVGKFLSSSQHPNSLTQGFAWPSVINPQGIVGYVPGGNTVCRIGTDGTTTATQSFNGTFVEITGAMAVTPQPGGSTTPGCLDLKPFYLISGILDQTNPQFTGNSTGFMLLNPDTLQPYQIGATTLFVAGSANNKFEDVCFTVYPGPDGDYTTALDNEYRFVLAYHVNGGTGAGLEVLSLNFHETENGMWPPNPWNPIQPERGAPFTNAYPRIDANSNFGSSEFPRSGAVMDNGQLYCRSYHLRPGIPGVNYANVAANRDYVLAGWVNDYQSIPPVWRPWLAAYDLGKVGVGSMTPIALYNWIPAPAHPFCRANRSSDCFKALEIIGDWGFATVCEDLPPADDLGTMIEMVYLPEMLDGGADGDDGYRGVWTPGASSAGLMAYMPSTSGLAQITYFGTGTGVSSIYATDRSPYSDWSPNIANAGTGLTAIDCHTDLEKQSASNFRQAPQGLAGFYLSSDPAENFPGSGGGSRGQGGSAGCSNSAPGGLGACRALLSLMAIVFFLRGRSRNSS